MKEETMQAPEPIDLRKEQELSLQRPVYHYSLAARFFFGTMDLVTGKKTTLAKTKLIETLASIPYRSWEIRQYARMTRGYKKDPLVQEADEIMHWGRDAQDNEFWHLKIINEKMRQDGVKDPWYLIPVIPFIMVTVYVVLTRMMALLNIRRAFLFNAEFEDHAEHTYAAFVADHPEWDEQPANTPLADEYPGLKTWGDVFRRIMLDEREHMNASFIHCGRPEDQVPYASEPANG
jgi:hypothetical protein